MQFSSQFLWLRRQGTTRRGKEHVRRPYSGAMVTIFSQLDIFISKLLGNVNKESGSTGDSYSVRKHFHCTKTLFECLFEYCLDVFVGHLLVSFLELVRLVLVVFFLLSVINYLPDTWTEERTDGRTFNSFNSSEFNPLEMWWRMNMWPGKFSQIAWNGITFVVVISSNYIYLQHYLLAYPLVMTPSNLFKSTSMDLSKIALKIHWAKKNNSIERRYIWEKFRREYVM